MTARGRAILRLSRAFTVRLEGAVRRREFIIMLGGATTSTWSVAAHAQQPKMPVIGILHTGSADYVQDEMRAFFQALGTSGFVEGRNVAIEYRWGGGSNDRLKEFAGDLARRRVAVIAALGGGISQRAAKEATTSIPIVFSVAFDPVEAGLVASFNRPG